MAEVQKGQSMMDRAVLLSISWHGLGTRRAVASSDIETDADRSMVHVAKDLFESPALKAITKFDNEWRAWVRSRTSGASFLRAGCSLLSDQLVLAVDAENKERAAKRAALVDKFMVEYPLVKAAAKTRLGSLYDDADYPNAETVRCAFFVEWHFLEFNTPSKLRGLSPEKWAEEQAKLSSAVKAAADDVVILMRAAAADLVDHLVERLSPDDTGKTKIFRDSLVVKAKDFLDTFKARNIASDAELEGLIEQARGLLSGVEADNLRESVVLRDKVKAGFETIKASLDTMLVDRPKRRIVLGDEAAGAAA